MLSFNKKQIKKDLLKTIKYIEDGDVYIPDSENLDDYDVIGVEIAENILLDILCYENGYLTMELWAWFYDGTDPCTIRPCHLLLKDIKENADVIVDWLCDCAREFCSKYAA